MPLTMRTLWLAPRPRFSARGQRVADVGRRRLVGQRGDASRRCAARRCPPAVDDRDDARTDAAGTVSVSNCWSAWTRWCRRTTVRTLKLPTPRPSMAMARSLTAQARCPRAPGCCPRRRCRRWRAAWARPASRSCVPLPSTVTAPERASAGTTTLSVVPPLPALPVRVRVPSRAAVVEALELHQRAVA